MSARALGVILVVISACGFGSGALFAKPIYAAGVDWMTLLAWRFFFAAILSWGWLLLWPPNRRSIAQMTRRQIPVLIVLGVLYTGNTGSYYAALETVPASLAALIVYLYPALVAVMAIRFAQRLEGRRAWIALGIATAGVAMAVGGIDPAHAPPPLGLALIVATPVIYAVWIILAARLSGEHRSDDVASHENEPAPASAVMLTATAAAWWTAALATGRSVMPQQIPAEAWLPLFAVGLVSTALAFQSFYAGVRRIGAAQAAIVSTVEPIWTIVLATLLFGEILTPLQIGGGVLVIAGVLLAQTGSMRKSPATVSG